MMPITSLIICLGAGIVGGVFFAFSTFVMKALHQLPPSQGVLAMQRINTTVINPAFMSVFVGTALSGIIGGVLAVTNSHAIASAWLVAAGALYLAGSLGVTLAYNVPRNERLARMEPDSAQALDYWPVYVREWLIWNHVRTLASLVSAACAAMSLVTA